MKNVFLQLKCTFPGSGWVGGSPSWGVSMPGGGGWWVGWGEVLHLGGWDVHLEGGSPSRGFSIWEGEFSIWRGEEGWGVLHPGGSLCQGGPPSQGVLHPGGWFSIRGGSPSWGVGSPSGGVGWGSPSWGFLHSGGVLHPRGSPSWGGVPCDLSHHAFDVTCMLPAHQLRPTNSAAAYILLVM